MITWHELVEIEPRLQRLLDRAKAVWIEADDPEFDGMADFHGYPGSDHNFKREMIRLVGWEAESHNPTIHTMEAYDVAYHVILNAMEPEWAWVHPERSRGISR
jgi:hypothetical protein